MSTNDPCGPCGIGGYPQGTFSPNVNIPPPAPLIDKCSYDRQPVFLTLADGTIIKGYRVDSVVENGSVLIRYETLMGTPINNVTETENPCNPGTHYIPMGNTCVKLSSGTVVNAGVVGKYNSTTLVSSLYFYNGVDITSQVTTETVSEAECLIARFPLAIKDLATVVIDDLAGPSYRAWPTSIPAFDIDVPVHDLSDTITHWLSSTDSVLLSAIVNLPDNISGYAVGI